MGKLNINCKYNLKCTTRLPHLLTKLNKWKIPLHTYTEKFVLISSKVLQLFFINPLCIKSNFLVLSPLNMDMIGMMLHSLQEAASLTLRRWCLL